MIFQLHKVFDFLDKQYSHHITSRIISSILILVFGLVIVSTFVINSGWTSITPGTVQFFTAINASFTTLLVFEILSLIFVLPQSVADSMGKQFEILSIILLRDAFKQFGTISPALNSDASVDYWQLMPMLIDALGALIIFVIIGFYMRQQRHVRITSTELDQQRFIDFKKVVALLLLIAFLVLIVMDFSAFFSSGTYDPSFNTLYTLLIFSDILILLFSLRYQSKYINLFRYSSFAFATILIRLSLSAPAYINVIIGVTAGVFVLGLSIVYNKFTEEEIINPTTS